MPEERWRCVVRAPTGPNRKESGPGKRRRLAALFLTALFSLGFSGLAAPCTLTTTGVPTVNAGTLFTLNLSASGGVPTSWTINWGDGSIETFAGNPASVTHTYNAARLSRFTYKILASAVCGGMTYFQNDLVVGSGDNDRVNWYSHDAATNQAVTRAPTQSGPNAGLDFPVDAIIGPDGNVYVSGGSSGNVVRYNPTTGAFVDEFATGGSEAIGMAFGPDGHLYVADANDSTVRRYDGVTGAFIDEFVTAGLGGLDEAEGLTFGPDGNLYVADYRDDTVRRYDGKTGASLGVFISGTDPRDPEDLVFGPDGNLYVASDRDHKVLRYNGTTGAYIDDFVASQSGGMDNAQGVFFGPDGNLYVSSWNNHDVLRYNGTTGAYIDDYVSGGLGGIDRAEYMDFIPGHQVTVTTPTTGHHLSYATTDSLPATPRVRTLWSVTPTWTPEAETVAATTTINWIVSEQAPLRNEEISVVFSNTPQIDVQRWNGTTWSSEWSSTTGLTATNALDRGIAVAYEQTTGDAMVVYTNNSSNLLYRTWNGATWSGPSNVFAAAPGSGTVRWVELASDPTTDRIALVFSDTSRDSHSIIWNGTSWDQTTIQTLETTGNTNRDHRDVDIAYENSGDLMVVVADGQGFDWWTMAAGTTTWVDGGSLNVVNGAIAFIDIAAEPGGDRIALLVIDQNAGTERIGAATWTGAAWANVGEYDSGFPHWEANGPGTFWAAAQWRGTTGEAVIAFADDNVGELGWMRWTGTGTGWVVQSDESIPGMSNHIFSMQAEIVPTLDSIVLAFSDSAGVLRSGMYSASGWSFGGVLNNNLTSLNLKPFSLAPLPPTATAVELVSFDAESGDQAVTLSWETASELDNLGFHLYRSSSSEGPYERITPSLIPGLGSSPVGARYHYRDAGLTNGATYFYQLEDIETTGRTERHGPVSATPIAASVTPSEDDELDEDDTEDAPSSFITYGDPDANTFRVVKRGRRKVVLELVTEGFLAYPRADGSVRIEIPDYVQVEDSDLPAKRAWVEALAGRRVELKSIRERRVENVGLRVAGAAEAEIIASSDGVVSLRRKRGQRRAPVASSDAARVVSVAFQGETKKALVEMAPLSWDASRQELRLTKKLVVTLSFAKRDPDEVASRDGRRGRRDRAKMRRRAAGGGVMARLATKTPGLYAVSYESIFGTGKRARRRGVDASRLRLSRLGENVAFHLEPAASRFASGSTLYFLSPGGASNSYGDEAVFELEYGVEDGARMMMETASPSGAVVSSYSHRDAYEEDRIYQAALMETDERWLWDAVFAPGESRYTFAVDALDPLGDTPRLELWLQGGSDFPVSPDHHAAVYVNGAFVADVRWDGELPEKLDAELWPGLLVEGENDLVVRNVGDTAAAYSMIYVDRFDVAYPRYARANRGTLTGTWTRSGTAEVSALSSGAFLLDTTDAQPVWLFGATSSPSSDTLRFRAEQGRSYYLADSQGVQSPEIRSASQGRLTRKTNRADYIVLGPQAFLDAAWPLLEHRRRQGLATMAVSIEDIYAEFGFGERRPEAIRDFLTYAYHEWRTPSPRYVLLLGDGTYDFEDHHGTGVQNHVPPMILETRYLWTASDPAYAAVNGDDLLPDLAIGRLSVSSVDDVHTMVGKILAYEGGGGSLDAPVVLVSDNRDAAGDFAVSAKELAAGVLSSVDARHVSLEELGTAATRQAVQDAFNEGSSVVSYIGHGGIHLWADEQIFRGSDVDALTPQAQQPFLLTMNCLNGYFHFPFFDALSERLVNADAKGAIAAFSPSGMSLNEPAHQYHEAILNELLNGAHERLGDAVLAAQEAYAEGGSYPELLSIYHLFGDPALSLR